MERLKEIFFLIIFIVVASFATINLKNIIQQEMLKSEISVDSGTTDVNDSVVQISNDIDTPTYVSNKADADTDTIVVKSNAVGVIDIPEIGVRAQIMEGVDDITLQNYVGKFKDSIEFGEIGNVSLAAHNNIYTEIFRNLHKLETGDRVRIITKDTEYIYGVFSKQVVEPSNIEVLAGSNIKELTLITCTDSGRSRVIVKCELISQSSLKN